MCRALFTSHRIACALLIATASLSTAQEIPEGPGRDETAKLCKQCHELARSVSLRQDRDGWNTTLNKMVAYGMKATPEELSLVLDFLAKHYAADEIPRVNVNQAAAIELESRLNLKRSQAAALIAHREKNGPFKTIDDLKKVPSLDPEKIEEKKNRIAF